MSNFNGNLKKPEINSHTDPFESQPSSSSRFKQESMTTIANKSL